MNIMIHACRQTWSYTRLHKFATVYAVVFICCAIAYDVLYVQLDLYHQALCHATADATDDISSVLNTADETLNDTHDLASQDQCKWQGLSDLTSRARSIADDPVYVGNCNLNAFNIVDNIEANKSTLRKLEALQQSIKSMNDTVIKSASDLRRDVALSSLKLSIIKASAMSMHVNQCVDRRLYDALAHMTTTAQSLVDNNEANVNKLIDANAALNAAIDEINAHVMSLVEASADQRSTSNNSTDQHAVSNNSVNQSFNLDSASWADDKTETCDPGDKLVQWRERYYIAHDWTSFGHMIANFHAGDRVIRSGHIYSYEDEELVTNNTRWKDIAKFATADGGIGFQTCEKTGYIIKHFIKVS